MKKYIQIRIQVLYKDIRRIYCFFSYRELPQVLTLVRVLACGAAPPAQLVVEPQQQEEDGFGGGDDVEGGGQRAALVKVTHPQFGASKLPLDVGVILQEERERGGGGGVCEALLMLLCWLFSN